MAFTATILPAFAGMHLPKPKKYFIINKPKTNSPTKFYIIFTLILRTKILKVFSEEQKFRKKRKNHFPAFRYRTKSSTNFTITFYWNKYFLVIFLSLCHNVLLSIFTPSFCFDNKLLHPALSWALYYIQVGCYFPPLSFSVSIRKTLSSNTNNNT